MLLLAQNPRACACTGNTDRSRAEAGDGAAPNSVPAAANDNPQITTTTIGNSGAKDGYAEMDPEAEMDFFRKLAGRG